MSNKLHFNGLRNLLETSARSNGRKIYKLLIEEFQHSTPVFDPKENKELLTPEKDEEGHWIGGPSVLKDGEEVYLYYRLRDPYRRGWKSVIAKTRDGEELEKINEFQSREFDAHSLEGGALQKKDGKYILYISYHEKESGQWKIDRIKANSVEELDKKDSEEMNLPTGFTHVKDPVIDGEDLIVHTASKNFLKHGNFRVSNPEKDPEIEKVDFTEDSAVGRITSTLKIRGQKYFFYDWLPSIIFTGEEKTKIGVEKHDKVEGLMPGKSAIGSSHSTRSLRYVKPVEIGNEIWFYYEKSMPGKGHKLCIEKMDKDKVGDRLDKLESSMLPNKEKVR